MKDIAQPFDTFFKDIAPLGVKRGPLQCQLSPSLECNAQGSRRSSEVVTHAVAAMEKIEASSKQISNIIGVIDEIAADSDMKPATIPINCRPFSALTIPPGSATLASFNGDESG